MMRYHKFLLKLSVKTEVSSRSLCFYFPSDIYFFGKKRYKLTDKFLSLPCAYKSVESNPGIDHIKY